MGKFGGFLAMGIIGVVLIVVGIQGSLGKLIGCIVTPSQIILNE